MLDIDANGATSTSHFDYFGLVTGHTDIGKAVYTYTYDNARQLTAQSNDLHHQNLHYGYDAAGQLLAITDPGTGTLATYGYDLSGRHIREKTVQNGVVYQDNHIAYDALGRMRWTGDARSTLRVDYDAVGNRTHINVHLNDSIASQDSDRFYAYDAMNRQTVVDAQDAAGTLGANGHALAYDLAGNRVSDVSAAGSDTYSYDAMERLSGSTHDGVAVDRRLYDGASRVIASAAVSGLTVDSTNPAVDGRTSQYDANGRLVHQNIFAGGVWKTAVDYNQYDQAGNLLGYLSADVGGCANSVGSANKVGSYRPYDPSRITGNTMVRSAVDPHPGSHGSLLCAERPLRGTDAPPPIHRAADNEGPTKPPRSERDARVRASLPTPGSCDPSCTCACAHQAATPD